MDTDLAASNTLGVLLDAERLEAAPLDMDAESRDAQRLHLHPQRSDSTSKRHAPPAVRPHTATLSRRMAFAGIPQHGQQYPQIQQAWVTREVREACEAHTRAQEQMDFDVRHQHSNSVNAPPPAFDIRKPKCPHCHGKEFVLEVRAADFICTGCARVVASRMIDSSAEKNKVHGGEDDSTVEQRFSTHSTALINMEARVCTSPTPPLSGVAQSDATPTFAMSPHAVQGTDRLPRLKNTLRLLIVALRDTNPRHIVATLLEQSFRNIIEMADTILFNHLRQQVTKNNTTGNLERVAQAHVCDTGLYVVLLACIRELCQIEMPHFLPADINGLDVVQLLKLMDPDRFNRAGPPDGLAAWMNSAVCGGSLSFPELQTLAKQITWLKMGTVLLLTQAPGAPPLSMVAPVFTPPERHDPAYEHATRTWNKWLQYRLQVSLQHFCTPTPALRPSIMAIVTH
jgi:hypothetical protein